MFRTGSERNGLESRIFVAHFKKLAKNSVMGEEAALGTALKSFVLMDIGVVGGVVTFGVLAGGVLADTVLFVLVEKVIFIDASGDF